MNYNTPHKISAERLERVARIYHSTRDAAAALGIQPNSLSRLFRQHQITPRWRQKER